MVEVKIGKLGNHGDGTITREGKDYFVPFTLPGEIAEVELSGKNAKLRDIREPSAKRIKPVCQHYTECGGCQLQHAESGFYREWKENILIEALARHGIDFKPDPMILFDAATRRRATFLAARVEGNLKVGFARPESHEIVRIMQCPVLVPELEMLLPEIEKIANILPLGKRPVRLPALLTDSGLDLGIEGLRGANEKLRQAIIRQALQSGFARVAVGDEVLIEARKPVLRMGRAVVIPPPVNFVQASREAEEALAGLVSSHLDGCRSVIDLYSGMGTFALRLAENSIVWAVEENKPALEALDRAWRETAGKLKQIKTEARNLDRRPVTFQEMKKFDGLVFDPPRAGAELQSEQIAKSKVKRVAAVSCNPTTLARDLSILLEGGYRLTRLVPVDQFTYTPHLEVVALLEK